MPLHELCRARALTQQTQAKEAENDPTRISNMEKRTDVSLRVLFFNATLLYLMWIPFQTTNFRNDSEIGAKEFLLHA